MNDAHFHLVATHLPIVGVLIGFLVLLSGYIIKNPQVKITALAIFIFSALTAIAAFYTGEGAEDLVENLPGISETLIHNHEEVAELFFTMMLVLGGASLLTLFFELKKLPFVKYGFVLVLLISIGCIVISKNVGTSGGEISHLEIRNDNNVIQLNSNHDSDDD
jgi:glucan phosphoethanolaminetransferase (alkaline phosphatase superfamily)